MKKILKYGLIAVGAIALLIIVLFFTKVGGAKIAEGTYKVKDSRISSEAYIQVDGNKIQFYNIDLNQIYREAQLKDYSAMVAHGVGNELSEEQLDKLSDLNGLFVSNAYEIDYDKQEDSKTGTFTYVYFCYTSDYPFGLVLEYNALHKTLQINSPVKKIVFEK